MPGRKRDAITQRFKELQAKERGEAPPEPELSDDEVIAAADTAEPPKGPTTIPN